MPSLIDVFLGYPSEPQPLVCDKREHVRERRHVSELKCSPLHVACFPTLAVTRRETGHVKWAALQLGYMTALAYVFALVAYQGLRLAGVS